VLSDDARHSQGYDAAARFYDALKLIKRLVNLGDAKSLACHPDSTIHRQVSFEEQRKAGVMPEMIRLIIGIGHVDDIIADLDRALDYGVQILRKEPSSGRPRK
jgi:O-acetylhomoserine (thiol)-lyase